MDGMETTAKIREREKITGEHVPVIALTAHAMAGDRDRCLRAGMDGYLIKPIQPATLLEAVRQLHYSSEERRNPAPAAKVVLDRAALMDRIEGDMQLLVEIAGAFPEECGKLMARAREAMESGSAERFANEIHTLHGMFRNLAAEAAQQEARKLEELDPVKDREEAQAIFTSLEREAQAFGAALCELAGEAAIDAQSTDPARRGPKKNPGEHRGSLNAQREGGARGFRAG
jgi:CheY-like chemotaxis protein